MGARRATVTAVSAVVGCVLLVAVLVTWAATIGPGGVLTGDGPPRASGTASMSNGATPTIPPSPTATNPVRHHDKPNEAVGRIVTGLLSALVLTVGVGWLLLVFLGLRKAWEAWQLRRRPPPLPDEIAFDVVETPRLVEERIRRDAGHQRALLLEGSPRNAIVACWHRFELQAGEVGLVRRDWETSSEFTLRVLDMVVAGSHDVARLAALYREARFSDHPLREDDRAMALEALDALHAELAARRATGDRA